MPRLSPRIASLVLCAPLVFAGCGSDPTTPKAEVEPVAQTVAVDDSLCQLLDEAIDATEARYMRVDQQAAWQIVHGILAFGQNLRVYADGQLVSALDYLMQGGSLEGWRLKPGDHGVIAVREPGSKTGQGHPDQWLGYLSLIDLPPDMPLVVHGQQFTLFDLVTQAQWDITDGMEATWTLMGLSTYLPLDATWTAADGQEWTLERVVEMEAGENINESACGGTHRLTGIAVALNRYRNSGHQLTGGWMKADEVVQKHIALAREYQQPDGCFSANFFIRPSSTPDIALKLSTTGHTLEFLTYVLSEEELREPWVAVATQRVAEMLLQTRDVSLECGALYHAAHALQLYRLRVFGERAFEEEAVVAQEAGEDGSADVAR